MEIATRIRPHRFRGHHLDREWIGTMRGLEARVGLLTAEGFRDVLEIGRASRAHEYDLFQVRPQPLVPRRLRLTTNERLDGTGRELEPLNEDDVRAAARVFSAEGVEAVAVAFL